MAAVVAVVRHVRKRQEKERAATTNTNSTVHKKLVVRPGGLAYEPEGKAKSEGLGLSPKKFWRAIFGKSQTAEEKEATKRVADGVKRSQDFSVRKVVEATGCSAEQAHAQLGAHGWSVSRTVASLTANGGEAGTRANANASSMRQTRSAYGWSMERGVESGGGDVHVPVAQAVGRGVPTTTAAGEGLGGGASYAWQHVPRQQIPRGCEVLETQSDMTSVLGDASSLGDLYDEDDSDSIGCGEELEKFFAECDTDGDGLLSFSEFVRAFAESLAPQEEVTDEAMRELSEMFGQLDTDADGKITYQEFLELALCVGMV